MNPPILLDKIVQLPGDVIKICGLNRLSSCQKSMKSHDFLDELPFLSLKSIDL